MLNMINPTEVRTNLEALANEFEGNDANAAVRLRNLSSAVGNGPNADAWAASNIRELVDPELIIDNYKSQRGTDRAIATIEWVRNTLIFAPLVVTWYGISQAVDKYNELIHAEPNQVAQPFLFLWQNGFGNRLASWQTLGSLAIIDFGLLSIVLALTVMVYFLSNRVKMKREQEAVQLRDKLEHTIACATLCLTTKGWQEPTNLIVRFNQTSTQFNQIIGQLLKQVEELARRQREDFQAFADFKKELATIMSTVSTSVAGLKDSNNALRRSMGELVTPASEVSRNLGSVGASAGSAVELYNKQIGSLEAVVQSQQAWGKNLQGVLDNLNKTVQTALLMTQKVSEFTVTEQALVGAMKTEREQQTLILGEMQQASRSLKNAAGQMEACGNDLRSSIVYMDKIARSLVGIR